MPDLDRNETFTALENVGMLDKSIFYVFKLDQVKFPEDYNLPTSQYKKIKKFIDKAFTKNKSEQKQALKKIDAYKNADKLNQIMYADTFIFVPSEPIMQQLVLFAAFQN